VSYQNLSKSLNNFLIKSLLNKLKKMRANGSNCADVLAKLDRLKGK